MSKVKTTPKDFFLYIAAMAALYVSAVSLIGLLFEYIDILFPSGLEMWVDPYSGAVRGFMATLIIVFPLYIFFTRVLSVDLRKHSEKRDLWIRKWLTYLTLFVAGATIVIDLVILLNEFLSGDLTTRFLLKSLTVLVVIGFLFYYYVNALRGTWEKKEGTSKMIGGIVSFVVLASIVSGFFIIGSPQDVRLMRFDQEKVSDLQHIQYQVVDYWQRTQELPTSLETLKDPLRGTNIPVDPQTEEAYEYNILSDLTFELCATFNRESPDGENSVRSVAPRMVYDRGGLEGDGWEHDAGETCFELTIDPEFFPEIN